MDQSEGKGRGQLPGWRLSDGKLQPIATPAGSVSRGASISGRRHTEECRRRVSIDFAAWIEHGLGDVPLRIIQRLYLCGRLHCGLKFNPEFFPGGAPIQFYVGDERPTVNVQCRSCKRARTIKACDYLKQMILAGTGDGNTGVHALSSGIKGACKFCGQRQWDTTFNLNTNTGPQF